MVYQPMIELLAYLRANGFKTFIVSGGGVDFMRGFAERVYGIPPEQVIGSDGQLKFELRDGKPVLSGCPPWTSSTTRRASRSPSTGTSAAGPIAAFGNSDGDLQMLQWTCAGPGTRYCLFVRHTDGERELAYDIVTDGRPGQRAAEAQAKGWTVVDMKNDWNTIYLFQKK